MKGARVNVRNNGNKIKQNNTVKKRSVLSTIVVTQFFAIESSKKEGT